jgi:hypothetical protein
VAGISTPKPPAISAAQSRRHDLLVGARYQEVVDARADEEARHHAQRQSPAARRRLELLPLLLDRLVSIGRHLSSFRHSEHLRGR